MLLLTVKEDIFLSLPSSCPKLHIYVFLDTANKDGKFSSIMYTKATKKISGSIKMDCNLFCLSVLHSYIRHKSRTTRSRNVHVGIGNFNIMEITGIFRKRAVKRSQLMDVNFKKLKIFKDVIKIFIHGFQQVKFDKAFLCCA